MENVELILITWNSSRYLDRCFEGIRAQTVRPRLVVVDNASTDGSVERAMLESPDLVIRNERNEGFAKAANQGFAATGSPFVCVLNPDVHLEPDYLERIIEAMEGAGRRVGTAAGKLLRGVGDGIERTPFVDSLGIRMTRSNRHFDIGAGEPDPGWGAPREVFGVSGAAIVLRRELIEDVAIEGEVFDEDFFTYREDADLAWRARLFGWTSLCIPAATGSHVRTVTPEVRGTLPPIINYHGVKNRFLLRIKNAGPALLVRTLPRTLLRDLTVLGATATVERSSFPAWGWIVRNRQRILRKRRLIQSRRSVDDSRILEWFE
ncbi:MAG: glycosyltransferase family 2 protein [Acidobacteria bacterium]|nr:glycosyltransferase family 2 protein [Acidobacteriota bacterium]